jgi:hypothetical protein
MPLPDPNTTSRNRGSSPGGRTTASQGSPANSAARSMSAHHVHARAACGTEAGRRRRARPGSSRRPAARPARDDILSRRKIGRPSPADGCQPLVISRTRIRHRAQPPQAQQLLQLTELLRTPRALHGGRVLNQELRVIFLRQHAEDPDRIIRIVIINRVRSHQATPFTVPQRTGARGRPQASILRTTSLARLTLGRTRTAHRTHLQQPPGGNPAPPHAPTASAQPTQLTCPKTDRTSPEHECAGTSSHLRSHGPDLGTVKPPPNRLQPRRTLLSPTQTALWAASDHPPPRPLKPNRQRSDLGVGTAGFEPATPRL